MIALVIAAFISPVTATVISPRPCTINLNGGAAFRVRFRAAEPYLRGRHAAIQLAQGPVAGNLEQGKLQGMTPSSSVYDFALDARGKSFHEGGATLRLFLNGTRTSLPCRLTPGVQTFVP